MRWAPTAGPPGFEVLTAHPRNRGGTVGGLPANGGGRGMGIMDTNTTGKARIGAPSERSNSTPGWRRKLIAATTGGLALGSLLVGARPAGAIVPGPNGLIAFE